MEFLICFGIAILKMKFPWFVIVGSDTQTLSFDEETLAGVSSSFLRIQYFGRNSSFITLLNFSSQTLSTGKQIKQMQIRPFVSPFIYISDPPIPCERVGYEKSVYAPGQFEPPKVTGA